MLRLKQQKSHKLSPPWEGPFIISKALLNGSYYLVDVCDLDKLPSKKRKRRDPDDIYNKIDRPWKSHNYILSTLSTYLGYVIGTSI
jgi:hypothetical protein